MASYSPYELIDDVVALLEAKGITTLRANDSTADRVVGAGQLLRGLGVAPLLSPEEANDRATQWSLRTSEE